MAKTIWKYPIMEALYRATAPAGTAMFYIAMPAGSEILTLQVQAGDPMIWALVDPDAQQVRRAFTVVDTGDLMPEGRRCRYVGTWQGSYLVSHLFEFADYVDPDYRMQTLQRAMADV